MIISLAKVYNNEERHHIPFGEYINIIVKFQTTMQEKVLVLCRLMGIKAFFQIEGMAINFDQSHHINPNTLADILI